MAKDTKTLGYLYGPPAAGEEDVTMMYLSSKSKPRPSAAGGTAVEVAPKPLGSMGGAKATPQVGKQPSLVLQIVYEDIVCTQESFSIDVFVAGARSKAADVVGNHDYVGRMTPIGMGSSKDQTRCRSSTVTRSLIVNEARFGHRIKLWSGGTKDGAWFEQIVANLGSGEVVVETEWTTWRGFGGRFIVGLDVGF